MAHAIVEQERWGSRFAAGVGLAAFALSLPIIRLLADAPEFFIAHGLAPAGTAWFLLAVIVAAPLAVGAVLEVLGRFVPWARALGLSVLGVVAVGGLLQPIASWSALFVVGALAGGVALAVAEPRSATVRSVLGSLTVLVLLLAVWSFGPSRAGAYVRSGQGPQAVATRSVGSPVVLLVFDEVSMVPALGTDLAINAERFPNLAALADTSHWFRQASSVSPQTSASVPALLSGRRADLTKVPVAADHPTNVFAQLGASMDVSAYEPITALCPAAMCEGDAGATGGASGSLVRDTALVLRHAVSSDAMRASLPSIEQGWAGFDATTAADGAGSPAHGGGYGTFPAQVQELEALAEGQPGGRPDLIVGHLIAPHMPWVSRHDGSTYDAGDPPGLEAAGGTLTWTGSDEDRRAGYQRYLLQVGALDRALGAVRSELESSGQWDDAIVVVTADHGVQFEPGGARAVGAGGAEVTNVPLFIKEPHQTEGVVETAPALTIDVLPTVMGLLGLAPRGELDGVDLLGGHVPEERTHAFLVGGGNAITPDQSTSALAAAVERRRRWIDPDGGWDSAYQPGVDRLLVGTASAPLASTTPGGSWTRADGEAGPVVTFELRASIEADAVLVVCGGTVAAALPASGTHVSGTLILSPEHCEDADAAELWVLDAAGRAHPTDTTP